MAFQKKVTQCLTGVNILFFQKILLTQTDVTDRRKHGPMVAVILREKRRKMISDYNKNITIQFVINNYKLDLIVTSDCMIL